MGKINRFLDWFDKKGGFYYHRWGDAEVRTLMISLFFAPEEIAYFDSLPYQHYHNYHCPAADRNTLEVQQAHADAQKRLNRLVNAKCMEFSRIDTGEGGKRKGEASMNPAEKERWNAMFWKHVEQDHGWTPL